MTKKTSVKNIIFLNEQRDSVPSAWEIEQMEKEKEGKSNQVEDQIQLPNPNDEAEWYWDELSKKEEEKPQRGIEIIDIYGEGKRPASLKDILMLSPHVFPFHSKTSSSPSKASKIHEAPDMNEGGYSKLMRSLTGQDESINSVGIITAENPFAKELSPQENKMRNKQLASLLQQAGYGFYQIQGKYGNIEKPYVIPNVSKKDIMAFGKAFEQQSVIYVERDRDQMRAELIYTDGSGADDVARNVVLPIAQDQEDFYSTYKGRKFVIPFFDDFFQDAIMKGGRVVKENKNPKVLKLNKSQLKSLVESIVEEVCEQMDEGCDEQALDEDAITDAMKAGQSAEQVIMGFFNKNKGVPVALPNILKAVGATDGGGQTFVRRKLDALVKANQLQFGKDQQGQEAWMKKKGWFN